MEYMCFNQRGDISTLNINTLKHSYFESRISSTETNINTWLAKAWRAIDWLSVILKSYLIDNIKRIFFKAAVVSILIYGCTTWTLTKCMEKKLDSNNTRMLKVILTNSWRHQPTKQQLYGNLPPITKTIQVRKRYAGHYWRSVNELISDILQWTPSHRRAKAGQPAKTYIQQHRADAGCSLEYLLGAKDDRTGGERDSGISMWVVWHDDDNWWNIMLYMILIVKMNCLKVMC